VKSTEVNPIRWQAVQLSLVVKMGKMLSENLTGVVESGASNSMNSYSHDNKENSNIKKVKKTIGFVVGLPINAQFNLN